ncbi:MAG: GTP-binding protein [Cytophagales bacterium]|nr:MAG: GTP-binding protein [Cytophagales bacterium]
MNKIPVTIVSGFLGAGKTTLLNHIIVSNPDKKIAIIENELGEQSIDHELIVKSENGIFELSNGCVCCSLNGELVEILMKLLNQVENVTHLVIETTGIADPGPVAFTFLADFKIQNLFRLDSIITLVDAPRIEQLLEETIEANKQIIQADVILINKSAQTDDYQREVLQNLIRKMNVYAEIVFTDYAKIDSNLFFERNDFSPEKVVSNMILQESKKKKFTLSSNNSSILNKQGSKQHVHSQIESFSYSFEESLDVIRFDTWLNAMLGGSLSKFYRVKGILNIEEFEDKVVLQSVGSKFITESGGKWDIDKPKISKIVFIGKNLDHDILEKGLKMCFYNEESPLPDPQFYESIMTNQVEMFMKNNL